MMYHIMLIYVNVEVGFHINAHPLGSSLLSLPPPLPPYPPDAIEYTPRDNIFGKGIPSFQLMFL